MLRKPFPQPPRPDYSGGPHGFRGDRFVGIDLGAETLKVVELVREGNELRCGRRQVVEHGKKPGPALLALLESWDWATVSGAAISGRLSRQVNLPRVPVKQAQVRGYRFLYQDRPATVVSIGSHGFSVLELRANGLEVFRENSRCSQGTGNFLRQLVERFGLSLEDADQLCAQVADPAPLSGRCPVILKTDMTHLANKGEDRARILAGLFDAVCENVMAIIKPGLSPAEVRLTGGVSQARRIQNVFKDRLAQNGMRLAPFDSDGALYLEALGCAAVAAGSGEQRTASSERGTGNGEQEAGVPPLERLLAVDRKAALEVLPGLSTTLGLVNRLKAPPAIVNGEPRKLALGFDIGSTGSKAAAVDLQTKEMVWDAYLQTRGHPVGAAQALVRRFLESSVAHCPVQVLGVTGSGREIVGSLMTTCYGKERVFILNEIAAHAEGATHYDPQVDTIFEIGGQDAKYIRLAGGKVIDCAMNEACSAGTGSFIEEQGGKFSGVRDVVQLGEVALAAPAGLSLGQHCSVFMAEIIDEAVAAGMDQRAIIAGLYDSIIQNYLHRVKGSRSVGQVIFCQGMPFASDALAAAVARQTGGRVVVPPNPGAVGALGIALLARRELAGAEEGGSQRAGGRGQELEGLALDRFLGAAVESKETFPCPSTRGCGEPGNRCRIDCLRTLVEGRRQNFTWGGGCSLHDKASRKKKLPDLTPDPFREREALVKELTVPLTVSRGRPRVVMTDEFALKELFPFFATFIYELGFDLEMVSDGSQATLKRGIQEANVPFCAPMQLYHGLVSHMAGLGTEFIFLPMLRELPRVQNERYSVTCPIVQASADLLGWKLKRARKDRSQGTVDRGPWTEGSSRLRPGLQQPAQIKVISPVINIGEGDLQSPEFLLSCQQLAKELGLRDGEWLRALRVAQQAQQRFGAGCQEIGRRALAFCTQKQITPVVVLGRPYTIYNPVLNSNVPAILRQQGAVGIPLDCYPVDEQMPVFEAMYWGNAQRILRAAHQVRRTAGVYSLYCSNYSCGPDSFNLHFFSHIMEGKPFAIIETDGHSGDAGTKTRVEAFLHCVGQDSQSQTGRRVLNDFREIARQTMKLSDARRERERILIPWMGPSSTVVAACLRGSGIAAEALPMPDLQAVRLGRRHTSGKECLPMCLTLGSLIQRVQQAPPEERFAFLMPKTHGPCRLGVYHLLDRVALERLGWNQRVRIWSPADTGYFDGLPPVFAMLVFAGFAALDLLYEAYLDARPVETRAGAAGEILQRRHAELLALLENKARENLSTGAALWQVASRRVFGVTRLLAQAAAEFAAIRGEASLPTVMVVGEIYVRCDPFANDFVIDKLHQRGLRVRFAPPTEWLEYCDHLRVKQGSPWDISRRLTSLCQKTICEAGWSACAKTLGWATPPPVPVMLASARSYLRDDLRGEAVLTVGNPLQAWRQGEIDAVLSVGPLECMPNKVAEAHFCHITENEGLPALTLSLNGDPVDDEMLDNFAFEIYSRRKNLPAKAALEASGPPPISPVEEGTDAAATGSWGDLAGVAQEWRADAEAADVQTPKQEAASR